jgi:HSP20 family protein
MNNLTRWEPMREAQTMRQMLDRFFDEPFFAATQGWGQASESFMPALDVIEEEDQYIVKASLPDVDPNQIEVTLTDNVLTIRGETKHEQEQEKKNYHMRERRFGSFMRQVSLPMPVESDKVEAMTEHGVLTLHLPKAEAVKPKKIAVKTVVNGE